MSGAHFSGELDGLLLSLQVYLQKEDLSAFEQELPALKRAAASLKKRHDAVLKENEQLKDRIGRLERKSRSVQTSLKANIETYKSGLETFHRFKDNIEIVQKMRSLKELPSILEELRLSLEVSRIDLALCRESFEGSVPNGTRLLDEQELEGLLSSHSGVLQGRSFYIGAARSVSGMPFFTESEGRQPAELQHGSCFLYPLRDKYRPTKLLGLMLLLDKDEERYSEQKATDFLQHFCHLFGVTLVSVLEHEKLAREKVVDGLTGAYNREYLRRHAQRILDFAERKGFPVSLLFMDLDGFKAVNDTLGHNAGDRLLQQVVQAIRQDVRRYDIFVRLGGDEFVILLPGTSLAAAQGFKERLIAGLERLPVLDGSGETTDLTVSASAGVVEWTADCSLDEILQKADQVMYQEKRARKESTN
jgi:diguanylate cyclase (GGDEF)-like protein